MIRWRTSGRCIGGRGSEMSSNAIVSFMPGFSSEGRGSSSIGLSMRIEDGAVGVVEAVSAARPGRSPGYGPREASRGGTPPRGGTRSAGSDGRRRARSRAGGSWPSSVACDSLAHRSFPWVCCQPGTFRRQAETPSRPDRGRSLAHRSFPWVCCQPGTFRHQAKLQAARRVAVHLRLFRGVGRGPKGMDLVGTGTWAFVPFLHEPTPFDGDRGQPGLRVDGHGESDGFE